MKLVLFLGACLLAVADATAGNHATHAVVSNHDPHIPDSIPADRKDVGSIEGIIAALYEVISGPAGQKRNWDRLRTLFIPEARLIPTGKRADGSSGKRVLSVEDYINTSGPFLEKNGFFEVEIGRRTDQFGNIVHVFSAYASKKTEADEKPFMRGINSIQLWNDGTRWWIVTIFWQNESPDVPIPEQYLKK
ncbi:MAG TPA: hypothetical protein VD993_14905 [Chitinophagaceae bacterium]|nr:hypothetical protein [Chitinophagaceae bacterium]